MHSRLLSFAVLLLLAGRLAALDFLGIGNGEAQNPEPPRDAITAWGLSPRWMSECWARNEVVRVQLIHCTSAANIAWPGERPTYTFQFANLTDRALHAQGRVRLISYELFTRSAYSFDVGMRRIAECGVTPIEVRIEANGWADVAVTPDLPAAHGGYVLIVELEGQDALFGAATVRTFKPVAEERRLHRLVIDLDEPQVLQRLGTAPNRVQLGYKPTTDADFEEWYRRETDRTLAPLRAAGLPVCVEFGGGDFTGPTQPLGVNRPHLDDQGRMLEGKADIAWLPSYDADYRRYIKRIVSEWGWPKGPINAVKLWNEPWNGLSICYWGADDQRYREIFTAFCDGVDDARAESGAQVLIGGCDSTSNTLDKLFANGREDFLQRLDFISIHYQGNDPGTTIRLWRDRLGREGKPSPIPVWDTESWVANSDDRIAGVLSSMYAFGQQRAVGIMAHHVVAAVQDREVRTAGGVERRRIPQAWSPAASVGAFQHFVGERTFRRLLFRPGLPYAMEFAGDVAEDATLVVVGDLGSVFGYDRTALRTCRSLAEVRAKEELRATLRGLPSDSPERAAIEERLAEPMPFSDCTLTIAADPRYALYDFYGNRLGGTDGRIVVPLDARGFYLRGDGRPGSHAALVAAVEAGRIDGISPVAIQARDMTAPVASSPRLEIALTNVLNRPVIAALRATLGELRIDVPASVTIAPHQVQVVAITITGGTTRPDNRYPLRLIADFGADGTVFHDEDMRVNWVAKRTVKIDGKLDDWKDAVPQSIVFKGKQTVTLTEKAWLPFVPADESVKQGFALGFLAYDQDNFYFAAKVTDTTPHPGAPRFADRRHEDDYFYPEVSTAMTRERASGEAARDFSARWTGFIQARHNGRHRISVDSDDGVRLWIGDRQLIDHWGGPTGDSDDIELVAGERRAIRIEYNQGGGQAFFQLFWEQPGGGRELVPSEALYRRERGDEHGLEAAFYANRELRDEPVQRRVDIQLDYKPFIGAPADHDFRGPRWTTEEYRWPAGVRRYTYRQWPILPSGNSPNFDNIQIAFNVLPDEEKSSYPFPPGTFKGFIAYPTTDYEYALNTVAPRYGGGTEVWRLDRPGMPHKHFYPRQPASPEDGPAQGAKLVTTHEGATRITECAIPWSEIPAVKAALDAGRPISFSYRVNDDAGVGCMELPRGRSASNRGSGFRCDWQEHWTNELVFGFEK